MGLESTFEIEVTGDIKSGKKFDVLTKWVTDVIKKLDPNVVVKEHIFAAIGYRTEWTGKPINFMEIDIVQSKVGKYTRAFLVNWEYKIIIHYKEKL